MRRVTEATAKVIEEAMQAQITVLQPQKQHSLRVANKIRLLQNAIRELTNNKYYKNENRNRKKCATGSL